MRNDKDGIAELRVSRELGSRTEAPLRRGCHVCLSVALPLTSQDPPISERKHCWKGQEANLLSCATTFRLYPRFGSPEILPNYRSHWWNRHSTLPVSTRVRDLRVPWKAGSNGSVRSPYWQEYSFPPQWVPPRSEPLSCHSSCSKYHPVIVEGRKAGLKAIKLRCTPPLGCVTGAPGRRW